MQNRQNVLETDFNYVWNYIYAAYTSTNWDEGTGGEFSEEKVFDTVKYVYDNMPGKELHNLVVRDQTQI